MPGVPFGSLWIKSFLGLLLILISWTGFSGRRAVIGEEPVKIREYRDTHSSIDLVDAVRALSADKARELEDEIKSSHAKLSPTVVRVWKHDDRGRAFDENGHFLVGGCSGVVIDRTGLILTCSHHGLAPDTAVTIELSDGKRVDGKTLGRFQLDDAKPTHFGPDIGLAKITEPRDWPAAMLSDADVPNAGQICLAIGYPVTVLPKRPPLLRTGGILPSYPDWP
jgi:S1-C subfamily serine protease